MIAYENDVLTIPKKYKKMSVSELEREKARLLKEIKASVSQKKQVRTNKKNINFNFQIQKGEQRYSPFCMIEAYMAIGEVLYSYSKLYH